MPDFPKTFVKALLASFDWTPFRRPLTDSDSTLQPATIEWLDRLPSHAKPTLLARRFPRIANDLCTVWPDANALADRFDELLVDRRGERQGFPAAIAVEIQRLQAYSVTTERLLLEAKASEAEER